MAFFNKYFLNIILYAIKRILIKSCFKLHCVIKNLTSEIAISLDFENYPTPSPRHL